jgi:nucleoside-diphosphate-sugar epimerase
MKLIVGCGYLGSRVARLWRQHGDHVAVVTRSAQRADELQQDGYFSVVADVTDAASLGSIRSLGEIDTVLYAVGFDRTASKSRQEVYVEGLRNLLDAMPPTFQRLIYIGTTSVYGQTDGGWIDEESPCQPASDGGRASLAAESVLRGHSIAARSTVLRLAGIYGPRRIPRREELVAGKPLPADPDAYLNLIHVDDAARVILAVAAQIEPPRTYLLSDGNPVLRRAYYAEAARLLGAPSPEFATDDERSSSDARGATDKRINNSRLVNEIGYQFLFPTYKQGLAGSIGSS